ncbi:MAG: VanZ family protein [Bacteroidia bacterium]|nr:VanZ family protein [Bacteroidia bacterium]
MSFVKRTIPFFKYQSPALLWGLFICLILLLPIGDTGTTLLFGFFPVDKLVHVVLFSFFALFSRVGWAKWYRNDFFVKKANTWTVIEGVGLAFLTESLQELTFYRTFSFLDIVADIAGISLGLLLFILIYKL